MRSLLTDSIDEYIHILVESVSGIESVWLIGSRANGTGREESDWDFFVFGEDSVYSQIESNPHLHNQSVDLLVVSSNGSFSRPYGNSKTGTLEKWKWNELSKTEAAYRATKWIPDKESLAEGEPDMGDWIEQTLKGVKVYGI